MKKFLSLTVLALTLVMSVYITQPVEAAADTCTWTGAVDSSWSDGGNWTGCDNGGVPENGDALIFPEAASNKATTNNDLAPQTYTTLQISGSGYTLSGAGITLSGTTPLTVNQNATIDINITYAPSLNAFLRVSATQTLTVTGTTTFSGVGGEVNVGGGGFSGTIDFTDNINGDAGNQFIAASDARIIVRGATNNFSATDVGAESDGIFECRSTTCFGDNANNIYSGNGIVEIRISSTFSNDWRTSTPAAGTSWLYAYESVSITGTGTVNDAIGISQETDGESLQFTGDITNTSAISVFGQSTDAQVRFDGAVSGAGGFSFGSGTTFMSAANTFDGTNTVNSGAIVIVDIATGLGSTTGITNVLSGSSVRFNFSASSTVDEPLQLAGSGIAGEGAIVQTDETTILSGDIVLDADTTIGVDTAAAFSRFELSGVISGTADILLLTSPTTVVADSSIQFTGSADNTYVGKVTAQGVRFYPDKAGALAITGDLEVLATATKNASATTANDEVIADTALVTVTTNGANTADFIIGSNATETIGYIAGDGEVSLGGAAELILTYAGDYTFAGDISRFTNVPAGAAIFTKQGAGTASFTGGVNTSYIGGLVPEIHVSAGTLKTNTASFTQVPVVVSTGSVLKGTGTIGSTIIQSGGAINVGNSPGCMTLASLNLNNGATFTEEIAGNTACTSYDQTTVTGTATITNATLQINLTTTPTDGQVFTILTAGSVVGTFNGLADGANITVSGVTFRINYTATTVTLTKLGGTNTTTNTTLQSTGVAAMLSILAGVILIAATAKLYKRNDTATEQL